MLSVAVTDIQALYESQPLLTQAGGFSPLGSAYDADDGGGKEEEDDSAG